jgi:hypothetical protein
MDILLEGEKRLLTLISFERIKISLAFPGTIRFLEQWWVKKPETINYRTCALKSLDGSRKNFARSKTGMRHCGK